MGHFSLRNIITGTQIAFILSEVTKGDQEDKAVSTCR
jgi:hypothetical protein